MRICQLFPYYSSFALFYCTSYHVCQGMICKTRIAKKNLIIKAVILSTWGYDDYDSFQLFREYLQNM